MVAKPTARMYWEEKLREGIERLGLEVVQWMEAVMDGLLERSVNVWARMGAGRGRWGCPACVVKRVEM